MYGRQIKKTKRAQCSEDHILKKGKKKIKNKIQHNPGNTGFEWFGESINENDDGVWN